jgi:hypothetical protein
MEILSPLDSSERSRVVKAALMLLGDESVSVPVNSPGGSDGGSGGHEDSKLPDLSGPAMALVRKFGLSGDQMQHYLHFDQGKAILIGLPGNVQSKREQTLQTYLLVGAAAFLSGSDGSFSDAEARAACQKFGCYDGANHSRTLEGLGNKLTGSKSAGWKLTNPGLAAAAELLKLSPIQ